MLFPTPKKNKTIYFTLFLCFQIFISPIYSFQSQFITYAHDHEAAFFQNIDNTEDVLGALIASGVDPVDYSFYTSEIERWKSEIDQSLPAKPTERQIATAIGVYVHTHVYTRYRLASTTLKDVFETGQFNCLSGTIVMNILLKAFGIEANSIVLPTHVYTVAILDGQTVEIENTIKDGLSISQDKAAQIRFNKLTGFDYADTKNKKAVVGWKETIGLLYSNRSYFDAQKSKHDDAFQNMMKAQVFLDNAPSEQKNLIAGYLNYSYYTYKKPKAPIENYLKTLSILEEGITRYPALESLKGNYLKGLDIVVEKMITLQAKEQDITRLLDDSQQYLHQEDFQKIQKSRHIRSALFQMRTNNNFVEAKKSIEQLWNINPKDKNTKDLIKEYSFLQTQKTLKDVPSTKSGANLLNDLMAFPLELTQEALGCYYSGVAQENFKKNDFEGAVQIMKDGKKHLGNIKLITQNGFVYAVNSAQNFINNKDYPKAIQFYKEALLFKNDRNVVNNLGILYEQLITKELGEKNKKEAVRLIEESRQIVPNHPSLRQLHSQS